MGRVLWTGPLVAVAGVNGLVSQVDAEVILCLPSESDISKVVIGLGRAFSSYNVTLVKKQIFLL